MTKRTTKNVTWFYAQVTFHLVGTEISQRRGWWYVCPSIILQKLGTSWFFINCTVIATRLSDLGIVLLKESDQVASVSWSTAQVRNTRRDSKPSNIIFSEFHNHNFMLRLFKFLENKQQNPSKAASRCYLSLIDSRTLDIMLI